MPRSSPPTSITAVQRATPGSILQRREPISFFLGQVQVKLFVHDFFCIGRLVHYDRYLTHHGRRNRTRPDFLGLHGAQAAIAVEAKGRSRGLDDDLVPVAYFDREHQWCAQLADPAQRQGGQGVSPAALTLAYYLPIVMAIRNREHDTPRIWDETLYPRTYF